MGGYVSLFNGSTAFSDAQVADLLPDLQSQVAYGGEFWWAWGISGYLDIAGGGLPLIIVDYPGPNDPAGALGYHYVDGNFQPFAVVFAALCEDYGVPVSGVISHELLEMLADQEIDTVNLLDNGDGTGFIVIQEVCDPCEQQLYYEAPNGNLVSDFVYPGWFVPGYPYQVDFLGAIPGPLTLASGGYISYQTVTLSGWQQVFGDKAERDMARAAEAEKARITAMGNPHADVIHRLQATARLGAAAPALSNGHAASATSSTTPVERRTQRVGEGKLDFTVVKRADVPKVGPRLTGPAIPAGVPGERKATTGPKVQPIPAE